jgi:hypothetical protein
LQPDFQPHGVGQAAHDGQPQPQSLAPVALRIAQLVEFAEHLLLLGWRNADAGIPYLDQQMLATLTTANQDAAAAGCS